MIYINFKTSLNGLILGVALLFVNVLCVPAQAKVSPNKSTAIRKLIDVSEMSRHTSSIFEELTSIYQKNWTESVIASFKAKGLLAKYSPQQVKNIEKVVHDFSTDTFDQIRYRMRIQVFTSGSLENVITPTFDKYLSEEEITELIRFSQNPGTQKLISTYYRVLTEATVLSMTDKGVFSVSMDPAAEEAKMTSLLGESKPRRLVDINAIFSTAHRLANANFTQSEANELSALANRPLAIKLAKVLPEMAVEIQANGMRLYGPQVAQLTKEVIDEQLKTLDGRFSAALKQ